ncbi:helix-turn-helix transcriptional regulator [Oscillospiraceae bacterium 38-13]
MQYFRRKLDLSQEQLAEKCGLSYSTISHLESTIPYPISLRSLYKVACALETEPYRLLFFD